MDPIEKLGGLKDVMKIISDDIRKNMSVVCIDYIKKTGTDKNISDIKETLAVSLVTSIVAIGTTSMDRSKEMLLKELDWEIKKVVSMFTLMILNKDPNLEARDILTEKVKDIALDLSEKIKLMAMDSMSESDILN